MYWSSFNDELIESSAIKNILSLIGSCLKAFIMSSYVKKGRFKLEIILNASIYERSKYKRG